MIPTWFALVCLAAAYWGRKDNRILAVTMVSTVFGAAAAANVVLMGSAPLTPTIFLMPFLVWFTVRRVGLAAIHQELSLWRAGGWLALFVGWAVFTAIVMPRYFEHALYVYTTSRGDAADLGVALVPLAPNSTNITQSIYLIAGLVAFVAVAALMRSDRATPMLFKGLVAAALLSALAAVINLVEGYSGVPLGLGLLRNANYAVTERQTIGGLLRIHGTFAETSAFSTFSVPMFAALLVLWKRGYRVAWSASLCVVTLVLVLLTTSTTAYVALAVALVMLAGAAALKALLDGSPLRFGMITVLLFFVLVGACLVLLFKTEWVLAAWQFIDAVVFQKLDSQSGIERTDWTAQAWRGFVDTWGLGVGAGSSRGSSWPVVLAGNTGFLGVALFFLFLAAVLCTRGRHASDDSRTGGAACKAGLVSMLVCASVSGATIDLGVVFYLYAGAVWGLLAHVRPERHRVQTRGSRKGARLERRQDEGRAAA